MINGRMRDSDKGEKVINGRMRESVINGRMRETDKWENERKR